MKNLRLQSRDDLCAAIMFIVVAGLFLFGATDYDLGTSRKMGPGYFPSLLSLLLLVLGLLTLLRAFQDADHAPDSGPSDWRGLTIICGSVLVFAQLLPVAGFLISAPILILLGSLANSESSWKERLALAAVLTTFCMLVFKVGLEMSIPLLPPALT